MKNSVVFLLSIALMSSVFAADKNSDTSRKLEASSTQSQDEFPNNDSDFLKAVSEGNFLPWTDVSKTEYDIGKDVRQTFLAWDENPSEANRQAFIWALGNQSARQIEIFNAHKKTSPVQASELESPAVLALKSEYKTSMGQLALNPTEANKEAFLKARAKVLDFSYDYAQRATASKN